MNMRERQAIIHAGPWILFDGTCNLCSGSVSRFGFIARRRGFRTTPLQGDIGREFRIPADEMQVITRDGTVIGGLEALRNVLQNPPFDTPGSRGDRTKRAYFIPPSLRFARIAGTAGNARADDDHV